MDRRLFVPAAHHFRRALDLGPSDHQRPDRWVLLCRAAQRTGQPDEVFRIVEKASHEDLPERARARMAADESMARLSAGHRPLAREHATEAVRLAQRASEPEAEGVASQVLGYLEYEANRIDEARFMHLSGAKGTLAVIEGLTGRPRAARRHAYEAIRLARIGRPRNEPGAWRAAAQAERMMGRLSRAESAIQRALSLSPRTA